jgi:hypothetical protein
MKDRNYMYDENVKNKIEQLRKYLNDEDILNYLSDIYVFVVDLYKKDSSYAKYDIVMKNHPRKNSSNLGSLYLSNLLNRNIPDELITHITWDLLLSDDINSRIVDIKNNRDSFKNKKTIELEKLELKVQEFENSDEFISYMNDKQLLEWTKNNELDN